MDFETKIINGAAEYTIVALSADEPKKLQQLCEQCFDYYKLHEGRMPTGNAGLEILTELPAGKCKDAKFALGVQDKAFNLVGVVDLIKNYKTEGEWTIGLIMIAPDERGKGLGKKLHVFIENLVRKSSGIRLRLGVITENSKAYRFWTSLGYTEIDRVNTRLGNKDNTVIVMTYQLPI